MELLGLMESLGSITLFIAFICLIFMLVCFAVIFSKAGYSKWTGLLMIIPIVNLIWFLVFTFSKWPILRKQQEVSQPAGTARPYEPAGTARPRQPRAEPPRESMLPYCPKCGTQFLPDDRFCGGCGFPRQQ